MHVGNDGGQERNERGQQIGNVVHDGNDSGHERNERGQLIGDVVHNENDDGHERNERGQERKHRELLKKAPFQAVFVKDR